MLKKILNNRRFKYGSMATIVTVIFIAAVVVFNIVAIMIVERLPVKVDLTSEKLFDIGSDTIEYVKNVEEDVTITVLATEDDFASGGIYFQQANEIIKKYPLYTDKINVRYVDLISSPDFAKKYTQDLREYDVIVETKERNKLIGSTDLFEITYDDYGNMTDVSAIAEQEITSALMFVTDKNPTTVTILTGRGEQSLPAFETLLSKNAYDVETTNILTEEISDDSDFVIIAGPESDYTQNEIKKLEEFLDNKGEFGKNIIYIASPTQPELPVLDSFLESWGIKIEDGILAETDTSKSYMSVFYNIHQFSSDNYTDKMDVNEPLIIMPVCRPVTALFEERGIITIDKLMKSYDTSVIRPSDANDDWTPADAKTMGEFDSVVDSWKVLLNTGTNAKSHVFAFGSIGMFSDAILGMSGVNNSDYILSIFNTLSGKEEGIKVIPKSFSGAKLEITSEQANVMTWLFVVILPVAVIAVGIITWVRRRHL